MTIAFTIVMTLTTITTPVLTTTTISNVNMSRREASIESAPSLPTSVYLRAPSTPLTGGFSHLEEILSHPDYHLVNTSEVEASVNGLEYINRIPPSAPRSAPTSWPPHPSIKEASIVGKSDSLEGLQISSEEPGFRENDSRGIMVKHKNISNSSCCSSMNNTKWTGLEEQSKDRSHFPENGRKEKAKQHTKGMEPRYAEPKEDNACFRDEVGDEMS
ncbi:unnamed protein product, partial [Protopolystoma xenopodis]